MGNEGQIDSGGVKEKKAKVEGLVWFAQNRFLMVPLIFTTCFFTNLYEPYKERILAACFGLHLKACSVSYRLILNIIVFTSFSP